MIVEDQNYKQFLLHLQNIWKSKELCRTEKDKGFKFLDDARIVIYSQFMNVINDYYLGLMAPILMKRLEPAFSAGLLGGYFPNPAEALLHANLGFLLDVNYTKTWHDMVKVRTIYSIWTIFEDYIDLIFYQVAGDAEIEIEKTSSFRRIKKIVFGKLDPKTMNDLKIELTSEYFPINNKYNYLLNQLKSAIPKKKLSEYREFLAFFNILRNTLHRNSRPQKDYDLNTRFGTFVFKKDKHIDNVTFETIQQSIGMFIEILGQIKDNLQHDQLILNPAVMVKLTRRNILTSSST